MEPDEEGHGQPFLYGDRDYDRDPVPAAWSFPEQVFRLFSAIRRIIRLSAKIGCTTFGLYFRSNGIVEVTAGAITWIRTQYASMAILMISMCD